MLTRRIAAYAKRLGLPMPIEAGDSRLGLAGTIRVMTPIALTLTYSAAAVIDPSLSDTEISSFVEELGRTDVRTWLEFTGPDGKTRRPAAGEEPQSLALCSNGIVRAEEVTIFLATENWWLRCVPRPDLRALMVIGVMRSPRRPPPSVMLMATFTTAPDAEFHVTGMFELIASQMRVRARIPADDFRSGEELERDFIAAVRRHLEALRNHAESRTPRADFEVVCRSPVRLRRADGEIWPDAFTRPETRLELTSTGDRPLVFTVDEVSDEGDVLSLEGDADVDNLPESGEVVAQANTASLKRMREALDAIATGSDESYGRLLEALTRPGTLERLPPMENNVAGVENPRQIEAKALALRTPDIALIHGPPGTGKTTVICEIIEERIRRGEKILLVAPTHVALDNVLERVGDRRGVTAIRLGSPENVEETAQRYLLRNRARDLSERLERNLREAVNKAPANDAIAQVQLRWADGIRHNDEIGSMLLLNANLICATPIGIATTREFRDVEVIFDVMILDEGSKATITDFLVPAARAKKWILVGDHKQLAPFVDIDELSAVVSERAKRAGLEEPDGDWVRELATRVRRHFDDRMHPNRDRVHWSWRDLVESLCLPFDVEESIVKSLVDLGPAAEKWRDAHQRRAEFGVMQPDKARDLIPAPANLMRLGAELLELQKLALPSVFEHLVGLPEDRKVRLNIQHRMLPALAEFSKEFVYENDYPSAPRTKQLGINIPTLEAPAIWIDTAFAPHQRRWEKPRDKDWSGGNYWNDLEIEVALEVIESCARWAAASWRGDPRGGRPGAPFEIGVVAFYRTQAHRIRERVARIVGGDKSWRQRWAKPAANGAAIDIHISIVDRFQGREKDVIVLCTTRSNPEGIRGHVDNLNRLNVAVTRARHKRIVIGDSTTLAGKEGGKGRAPNDLLRGLFESSEQKKKWGRALGGRS